jgi:O-methyltransferase involved in polyketide biosynthesis
MTDSSEQVAKLDTGVAHTARTWNYWLGGKDHFAADREVGEQILQFLPNMRTTARADRAFLGRAVRYLAGEAGIRQFLDVGTGLPTADNTHEVAQSVAPESRIVYIDNDPLVLVHARALLTSTPQGVTNYVEADLHDPDKILQEAARTLDFTQPVALTLLGVLNFIIDDDEAYAIVDRLLDAVPPGSYLAISHGTSDTPARTDLSAAEMAEMAARAQQLYEQAAVPIVNRTAADVRRLFGDWDLVDPGLVFIQQWRPDDEDAALPGGFYGAIGRKPGAGPG